MPITKDTVFEVLRTIELPGEDRNIVEAGLVESCSACDGFVRVRLSSSMPDRRAEALKRTIPGVLKAYAATNNELLVEVAVDAGKAPPAPAKPAAPASPVQESKNQGLRAKHIIAVGAGKGGVGKSTVAVNLAVGLALRGHAVGLMDGDIYGPSIPTMLGLDAMAANLVGNMLQPFYVHGIKSMTIGKLVDPEKPLIWRGPMAHGAFKQLVEQTEWGPLDYLIIDLPPGTGDVALTMAQLLKLTGAIVVCTPQKVAQDDAIRALRMFQQLNIEVLGVVENMSYFVGDDGKEYDIFGRGGAQMMAQRTGTPFLGSIPITMPLRANGDSGNPSANFQGNTTLARALDALCKNTEAQVALTAMRLGAAAPTLTIS